MSINQSNLQEVAQCITFGGDTKRRAQVGTGKRQDFDTIRFVDLLLQKPNACLGGAIDAQVVAHDVHVEGVLIVQLEFAGVRVVEHLLHQRLTDPGQACYLELVLGVRLQRGGE